MARNAFLSLFRSKPAAAQPIDDQATPSSRRRRPREPLPNSVIAAIEAASIVVRPGSRENGPRAIVSFPGRHGWTWSREGSAEVFVDGWPELTPGQLASAVSRLAGLVVAHMQDAPSWDETGPPKTKWADWRNDHFYGER